MHGIYRVRVTVYGIYRVRVRDIMMQIHLLVQRLELQVESEYRCWNSKCVFGFYKTRELKTL